MQNYMFAQCATLLSYIYIELYICIQTHNRTCLYTICTIYIDCLSVDVHFFSPQLVKHNEYRFYFIQS